MAPPRMVPDKVTMEHYLEQGLTHEAIRQAHYDATGVLVTRTAISAALQRYGLAGESIPRYKNTIPWRVKAIHSKAYPARMLRLLGRRLGGSELNEAESSQLDSWLTMLANEKAIVAYDPDDDQGFAYVDQKFKDHRNKQIPIRNQTIHLNIGYGDVPEE